MSIAAGSATATITVTPVDDALPEGNETVHIVLTPGTGYTVGTPSSDVVTILDNDSGGGSGGSGGTVGNHVYNDLDGDGLQGLGEAGIEGVTVYLTDEDELIVATTATNEFGYYEFTGVAPNTYSVTSYSGYAENATASQVTGLGKENDYSFKELEDWASFTVTPTTSAGEGGYMEADRTWVNFWAKDYGGQATVQVTALSGAVALATFTLRVPEDKDDDKLADKWEREQVKAWEKQYKVASIPAQQQLAFFDADDDKEAKDPDGADNGDGGANLPAHKTAGDSLTVKQEYRGFTLDGGGYDWDGKNPHKGGHLRLSPVFKELLIEADIMKEVPNMPKLDEIKTVLNHAAKGFSDKDDGAGIRMYWVIDQQAAAPHKVFSKPEDREGWATDHKNAKLSEFVHLMYADHSGGVPGMLPEAVFPGNSLDRRLKNPGKTTLGNNSGTPPPFD